MLAHVSQAADVAVGATTLHAILAQRGVILFFYPAAFTYGCTREAAGFGREYGAIGAAGYEVIGVSPDEQEASDRFRASLKLPFPLVGDPTRAVCRAYEATWPVFHRARRVTYVIAKGGRIERAYHDELSMAAHVDQACDAVRPPR
jgi:peroxiredoxin